MRRYAERLKGFLAQKEIKETAKRRYYTQSRRAEGVLTSLHKNKQKRELISLEHEGENKVLAYSKVGQIHLNPVSTHSPRLVPGRTTPSLL